MTAEYGHFGFQTRGIFIDAWGAGPYIIVAGGSTYYFEDSRQFGPMRLDAKGESLNAGMFPERCAFWSVWQRWTEEGRQTTEGKKKGFLYCIVSNGRRTSDGS